MKNLTIPKYDVLVSEKIPNVFGIHILEGEFRDIFISVGSIYYDSTIDKICYESIIIDKPESITEDVLESDQFKQTIQTISYIILQESYEENRNTDIEPSYL